MKMSKAWACELQSNLVAMVYEPDDLALIWFAGYPRDGDKEEEKQCWQEGMDLIYRMMKSKLLVRTFYKENDESHFPQLFGELSKINPYGDEPHIWLLEQLYTTGACKALVRKYGIDRLLQEKITEEFIEEIEQLFEEAGVPWTKEPLIPIQPTE